MPAEMRLPEFAFANSGCDDGEIDDNENDDDNWSMAEEMLNELLGDFTNNSNDEIRRVQQKRSDSAFSASTTSSGSADDVDTDSNHILTYKRWI